jgi:hypothetical protein
MRIIPAIDIIEGKCVRLTKGDYNTKKVYNEDPLEVAKAFEDNGIDIPASGRPGRSPVKHISSTIKPWKPWPQKPISRSILAVG